MHMMVKPQHSAYSLASVLTHLTSKEIHSYNSLHPEVITLLIPLAVPINAVFESKDPKDPKY